MAYKALNQTREEIRLLRLAPKRRTRRERFSLVFDRITGNRNSITLQCTLHHVSPGHHPPFEALSYVWGDPTDTIPIMVNGKPFHITKNLHSALEQLQHVDRERILWVDALCINQADPIERQHQVLRMRTIYSQAFSVIAWLGEASRENCIAMDLIETAAEHENCHVLSTLNPHIAVHGMTLESPELIDYVSGFFLQPWWLRVWTVQEFALAKRVRFMCGSRVLLDSTLIAFDKNLARHGHTCCIGHKLDIAGISSRKSIISGMNRLESLVTIREQLGTRHFLGIIAAFRNRESTDPRDRIYGMLGLAEESFMRRIPPDYTLSVEEVFERAAVAFIEQSKGLEILSHVYGGYDSGLPSFVPDWEAPLPFNHPTYLSRLLSLNLYRASGSKPAQVQHINGQLMTKCLEFDTVSAIGPRTGGAFPNSERFRTWLDIATADRLPGSTYCHTNQYLSEAFERTLFGDVSMVYGRQSKSLQRLDNSELGLVRNWLKSFTGEGPRRTSVDVLTNQRLQARFKQVTFGRRFFRTSRGYIGFGPMELEEGDIVAVIPGGKVPYILRDRPFIEGPDGYDYPATGCYTFLGDSYVHGIMYGEAMSLARKQQQKLKYITIM